MIQKINLKIVKLDNLLKKILNYDFRLLKSRSFLLLLKKYSSNFSEGFVQFRTKNQNQKTTFLYKNKIYSLNEACDTHLFQKPNNDLPNPCKLLHLTQILLL